MPRPGLLAGLTGTVPSLCLLVAGPGAGKTCAARLIGRQIGKPGVWLEVSGEGLDALGGALGLAPGSSGASCARSLLEWVREHHPAGATVVIDGAERADPATWGFLGAWIAQDNGAVSTIVTSRVPLAFPLARRVALGQVREWQRADLWFSPQEVDGWLQELESGRAPSERLRALAADLAGWPLGVAGLAANAGRTDLPSRIAALVREELLEPLPGPLAEAALALAPWPDLAPELLAEILPAGATELHPEDLVARLESWGCLVPDGEGRMVWHSLARRPLLDRWDAEPHPERRGGLLRGAARLARRDPVAAIEVLLARREEESAVAVARSVHREQAVRGPERLSTLLPLFSAGAIARQPELTQIEGTVLLSRGAPAEAESRFRSAAVAFLARGDSSRAFEALVDLLHVHWSRYDIQSFERVAAEAATLEPAAEVPDLVEYLNNLACHRFYVGAETEAEALFDRILDHPHLGVAKIASVQQFAAINLGILEMERGEFDEATRRYERALALAAEFPLRPSVPRGARLYLASIALKLGDRRKAEELIQVLTGMPDDAEDRHRQAEFLALEGDLHLLKRGYTEAEDRYRRAFAAFSELRAHSPDAGATLDKLATLARRRQEPEAAPKLHAKGLALAETWPRYKAAILVNWAITLLVLGDRDAAAQKLDEAAQSLRAAPAPQLTALAALVRTVLDWQAGRRAQAAEHLKAALQLIRQGPYYYLPISQREIAPDLWEILAASGHEEMLARIESRFPAAATSIRAELAGRRDAKTPSPSAALPPQAAPALEIRLLGTLEVRLAGEPIAAWPRKRGKALLGLLVLAPHGLGRQDLAEKLFPDLGWDAAEHQLDNLVSFLRRLLEPGLARRQASRYLIVKDQHYRFDLTDVGLDVAEFDRACAEGGQAWGDGDVEMAVKAWERASDLYLGDLLGDPSLLEWCDVERHRYRVAAVEIFGRLAGHYLEAGRFELARSHAERLLAIDGVCEEAHRVLMRLYARLGQPELARGQYEVCRRALRAELDTEPTAETRALFAALSS